MRRFPFSNQRCSPAVQAFKIALLGGQTCPVGESKEPSPEPECLPSFLSSLSDSFEYFFANCKKKKKKNPYIFKPIMSLISIKFRSEGLELIICFRENNPLLPYVCHLFD